MRIGRWAALGLVFACAACVQAPVVEPPPSDPFIAFTRDFEGFESWRALERPEELIPPTHVLGRSTIYVYVPPDAVRDGVHAPIGTRVLRVTRTSDDPTTWTMHGMAKRGGGYNPEGARDWEFFSFGMALDNQSVARLALRWRGMGPPDGDGYRPVDGGMLFSCNHCHGASPETDSLFAPELDPRHSQ